MEWNGMEHCPSVIGRNELMMVINHFKMEHFNWINYLINYLLDQIIIGLFSISTRKWRSASQGSTVDNEPVDDDVTAAADPRAALDFRVDE